MNGRTSCRANALRYLYLGAGVTDSAVLTVCFDLTCTALVPQPAFCSLSGCFIYLCRHVQPVVEPRPWTVCSCRCFGVLLPCTRFSLLCFALYLCTQQLSLFVPCVQDATRFSRMFALFLFSAHFGPSFKAWCYLRSNCLLALCRLPPVPWLI